jgi:hypothetical protein
MKCYDTSRRQRFVDDEARTLTALPAQPFELIYRRRLKAQRNNHIYLAQNLTIYSLLQTANTGTCRSSSSSTTSGTCPMTRNNGWTSWRSSKIATDALRPSSPSSFLMPSSLTSSAKTLSLTPPSTGSYTHHIASSSKEGRIANTYYFVSHHYGLNNHNDDPGSTWLV